MQDLPSFINTEQGVAYLTCGAYEAGWYIGYTRYGETINNLFLEAGTLHKAIKDLKDMLVLRQLVEQPSVVRE